MNNIKKIIAIPALVLATIMFFGPTSIQASEVTGTISSSTSSGSQTGGTIGGNTGSTISGTVGGGSGGSTVTGTVGGGGGAVPLSGNTASGGGSASGSVAQNTPSGGQVLGAATVSDTPGLPNTGTNFNNKAIMVASLIILFIGFIIALIAHQVVALKHIKTIN